jgi:hypothetical protein
MTSSEPERFADAVISERITLEKPRNPRIKASHDGCERMTANGATDVPSQLFLPSARQTNLLLIVGFVSLGQALYLRYLAIEYAQVSLACQAGLDTWLCTFFRLTIVLYNHGVFGWVALVAALLNLVRPSVVLVAVALAAAGFGLVLHNAGLAGLAAALLILSLARPAPEPE